MRQNKTKQAKHARHPPTPLDSFRKDKKKEGNSRVMKIVEDQAQDYEKDRGRPRSNQLAAVGGTSSTRHALLTSRPGALLPCLPSPSYFCPPRFPFYSSCCPPLPAFPRLGFLPLFPPPLPSFPWAPPTANSRRCLLSCASSSCHLTSMADFRLRACVRAEASRRSFPLHGALSLLGPQARFGDDPQLVIRVVSGAAAGR